MSEYADYYNSWLGCGSFGVAIKNVTQATPVVVFQPTDLSGLDVWFDGSDDVSVTVDSKDNTSILSWLNKGDLSGTMVPTIGTGFYNVDTLNGLNVVQFDVGNEMGWDGALTTQSKTAFVVSKQLVDLSGLGVPFLRLWNGSDSQAYQLGIAYSAGSFYYQICQSGIFCVSATDTTNYYNTPLMTSWRISTDLSQNIIHLNGLPISIYENYPASGFNTNTMTYTVNRTDGSSQDVAEIIIYNRALSDVEVLEVEAYLINKWGIV